MWQRAIVEDGFSFYFVTLIRISKHEPRIGRDPPDKNYSFSQKSKHHCPFPLFHLIRDQTLYFLFYLEQNIVEHRGIHDLKKGECLIEQPI